MKTLDTPVRRSAGAPVERTVSRPRRAAPAWHTLSAGADHAQWELVQRIISSRRFGRSTLLSDFLLFVTHRSLSGRVAEINEQQIGVHVFARGETFNPGEDNIVRSYARMLRKRLEEYFRHEGKEEPLLLDIPRGGYVPVFTARDAAAETEVFAPPVEEDVEPASGEERNVAPQASEPAVTAAAIAAARGLSGWRMAAVLLLAIALSGAAGFAIATQMDRRGTLADTPAERLSHVFWQQIFDAKRDTYVVPTDGGLVILRRFLEHPVTLSEYVSGSYKSEPAIAQSLIRLVKPSDPQEIPEITRKVAALGERRYTSVADLDLSTQLARRREVVPERLMIRYARDLRMDDLHGANAILIGSLDSNPWVELFQPQLNFQFTLGASFGGSAVILNRHPLPGEPASYASITGDPTQRTYGVIAYVPNLDGNGHVLLVEGINMAGTDAAGKFLLSPEKMQPVLEQALAPNGELRSFEVLLSTDSIAANSSRVQVLSERVVKN